MPGAVLGTGERIERKITGEESVPPENFRSIVQSDDVTDK